MNRHCEICKHLDTIAIFTQPYIVPGQSAPIFHRIVCCSKCGFVYAKEDGRKLTLDEYYKKANKYSNDSLLKTLPPSPAKHHKDSVTFLNRVLKKEFASPKQVRLVDIGSSTGSFLHLFQQAGYTNVQGVDPAPISEKLARLWWNIPVATSNLLEYKNSSPVDVVLLYSVFEHLESLDASVGAIKKLLRPGGLLFLSVPDVVNFGKPVTEPFMELSLEHINFFTLGSLTNLLGSQGFTQKAVYSHQVDEFGSVALDTVWQFTGTIRPPVFDSQGILAMERYVAQSLVKQHRLEKKLQKIKNNRIVVWGAGSLCSRLLATSSLRRLPIEYFIDTNPALHSLPLLQRSIRTPAILGDTHVPVLIMSYQHEKTMRTILVQKYGYRPNEIFSV